MSCVTTNSDTKERHWDVDVNINITKLLSVLQGFEITDFFCEYIFSLLDQSKNVLFYNEPLSSWIAIQKFQYSGISFAMER